ncbi:MAG: MOSC N-terminal beta barrel domain-containing protein [Cyanobacteria bacterium P01_F01_bin.53]
MASLTLSELNIYPVKSAAGISLNTSRLTLHGLQFDRRCMVVSEEGQFMTQRRFPRMALISIALTQNATGALGSSDYHSPDYKLTLSAPAMPSISITIAQNGDESISKDSITVEVWGDRTQVISLGTEAQQWLSQFLGTPCQLVYMPNTTRRPIDHGVLGPNQLVSFADAYPYLLISEASLAGLNEKLVQKQTDPVPMNRFRPNLVVRGCSEAHAEDQWKRIRIGEAVFSVSKPCARCSVPTIDQSTGTKGKGNEPIKTLSTYRSWDKAIWFGQNLVQENLVQESLVQGNIDQPYQLSIGDEIEVLA